MASGGIDFLGAVVGQLIHMSAVERGSSMRGDIDRSEHLPAYRVEGAQPVSGGKPDVPTVIRDATHVLDIRKGSVLTNNDRRRSLHDSILVTRQGSGE